MARLLSTVVSIAVTVAACYAVVLVAVFFFQSRLVYFPSLPSRAVDADPSRIGLAYQQLDIITEDGVRLDACMYLPPKHEGLFCSFMATLAISRIGSTP